MVVPCCDTIALCFTKLQGAARIIEVTQHSSRPPPLRDNSRDCCPRFVPSLTRVPLQLHHMTVPGAICFQWPLFLVSVQLACGVRLRKSPCGSFATDVAKMRPFFPPFLPVSSRTAERVFVKLYEFLRKLTHFNFG
jgi:hypothetical protein